MRLRRASHQRPVEAYIYEMPDRSSRRIGIHHPYRNVNGNPIAPAVVHAKLLQRVPCVRVAAICIKMWDDSYKSYATEYSGASGPDGHSAAPIGSVARAAASALGDSCSAQTLLVGWIRRKSSSNTGVLGFTRSQPMNKTSRSAADSFPRTPDGRYMVVNGRLWRLANPLLPAEVRAAWVDELKRARRAVRSATADAKQLRVARDRVDAAKRALGERGPVWWDDAAPDFNRYLVKNTPYASWHRYLSG